MVKDDWSPNPLSTGPRSLPEILKFRLILHMVKDDWPPPSLTAQNLLDILKFRLSLHKVKDDGPPHLLWLPRIYQKFLS